VKQDFSVSATTSYTLSQSVTSANDIALFINNVRQEPTYAYSCSGTALTLTAATASGDDMYCVYLGKAVGTLNPGTGSVGLAQLSASGTKNSTTFLRGDNSFAVPSGGKILQVVSAFKAEAVSSTSSSYAAVTGLEVTLTPSATSSKVLIHFDCGTMGNNHNAHIFFIPYRSIGGGSYSAIGLGTGGSQDNYATSTYSFNSGHDSVSHHFLDSPNTTSAIIYKMYWKSNSSSYTYYLNRRANDDLFRGSTSFTCMEVGA
jgi:hypothetical protein